MCSLSVLSKSSLCHAQRGALKHNLLAMLLVLAGLAAFAWSVMPPLYSTDLSLVGKGKPVVVMTYDNDNVASMNLVESFNQLRDQYQGQVEFVMADMSIAAGEEFADMHRVSSATAIFFAANGERKSTFYGPREPAVFAQAIHQDFGL